MATEVRRNREIFFTEGNTVRKTVSPVITTEHREEKRREQRKSRRSTALKAEGLEMSIPYVFFLFAMVAILVVSCIQYLDLNAKISDSNSKIATLQTQLDTLVTKNDAIDYDINGYVDVEYVVATAMDELGMIVGTGEQVKFYDSSVSEFMNQLSDVPVE